MSGILWPIDASIVQRLSWSGSKRAHRSTVKRYVPYHQQRLCKEIQPTVDDCFARSQLDYVAPRLKPDPECEGRVRHAIYRGADILSRLSFEVIHDFIPSLQGLHNDQQRWELINACFSEYYSDFLSYIFTYDVVADIKGYGAFQKHLKTVENVNRFICNSLLNAVSPVLSNPQNATLSRTQVLMAAKWNASQCAELQLMADLCVKHFRRR